MGVGAVLGRIFLGGILLGGGGPAIAQVGAICPSNGGDAVRIARVTTDLDVILDDGRTIRLAGLEPASEVPDFPERARTAARALAGQSPTFVALGTRPDRWGRVPGFLLSPGLPPGGLTAALIAAGWARYRAEGGAAPCRTALLQAEVAARGRKLGLWADPYYAVLKADDRPAFDKRQGTVVIAEGRVARVAATTFRTGLRLAAPDHVAAGERSSRGHMLVATISPRIVKEFKARGMDLEAYVGRTVRVRGLLDLRFGPEVIVSSVDALELVDTSGTDKRP